MNWKDIVIWFLQFALVEVSKRWPKVGDWVKEHAPAALMVVTIAVEILQKVLGIEAPSAGAAQADSLNVIPVHPSSAFIDVVATNYIGTIVVDNVIKKILWRWLILKVGKKLLGK